MQPLLSPSSAFIVRCRLLQLQLPLSSFGATGGKKRKCDVARSGNLLATLFYLLLALVAVAVDVVTALHVATAAATAVVIVISVQRGGEQKKR
jgi:hypothetical protein